jgi:molybdopterin-synthase adenylyltransferase
VALSNNQIERYSRQIIVPGIGGAGQERLLASHIVIAGDSTDIERALAYMVGAGVGRITLAVTDTSSNQAELVARMRRLNPDVSVAAFSEPALDPTLILALVGSAAVLERMPAICARDRTAAVVFARLDTPSKIAICPSRPPCPVCADGDLLAGFSRRSQQAGAIAMIAAAEAFKLLAGQKSSSRCILIEFNGYEAKPRELLAAPDCPQCGGRIDETKVRR